MVLHGHAKHGVKEKMVLAYNMMLQTRRMEKSIVRRATKDGPGCFILIRPKWKKKRCPQGLFWHWMLLPMTKDSPRGFILIQPTVLSLCVIPNRRRRKAGYVLSVILLEHSCGWW
jgi:hypothetical protein